MSENGRNKDYYAGKQSGVFQERERIIKLLKADSGQRIMCLDCSKELIALIKDETRNIRSEILPNGNLLIEEIKSEGENK